ncbi:hypothetical protein B277_03925 [Janibacter hoylei PVAS-1]|uniref:Uncharacterized protein n=1 Tax=Janibacter hoylei PVAS-1 TaxID=1210046 RepID=K1DZX8_9MICO|nr:hypothetical protein [Janibacter hoylei]EKA62165.1 hypothetical protein B277_03925 [Janibacter hoylei PVAS-1]RWU85112.1 hypothetical protein CWN80_02895 [Janibacter hoylei PVAS-1]
MSTKENRPEFCQRLQDDFSNFERAYYARRGVESGVYRPMFYPADAHPVGPAVSERDGWRVSFYTGAGRVGRAYPAHVNVSGPDTPDFSSYDLVSRRSATCDHECWPMPHPRCGCGVWASATVTDAIHQLRGARRHPGWERWRLDADARFIVYPVRLETVRTSRDSVRGPVELVGASAQITGPILTVHPGCANDWMLKYRGLEVETVGDHARDLIAHLEAMAEVSP